MNDKLKYDHFKNTKELLEHIAVWYRDDDVYFSRWFGLNDLNNLRIYINQLQSNWNSLRECIEENKKVAMEYTKKVELSGLCQGDYPVPYYHAIKRIDLDNLYLDKMNELESGDKEKLIDILKGGSDE